MFVAIATIKKNCFSKKRVGLTSIPWRSWTSDSKKEGVFIRGEHLKLPCPAIVELTFALDGDSKRSISHMEAIVIHHSRQGYGLMFKDFRFEAFQVLKDMLYAA